MTVGTQGFSLSLGDWYVIGSDFFILYNTLFISLRIGSGLNYQAQIKLIDGTHIDDDNEWYHCMQDS